MGQTQASGSGGDKLHPQIFVHNFSNKLLDLNLSHHSAPILDILKNFAWGGPLDPIFLAALHTPKPTGGPLTTINVSPQNTAGSSTDDLNLICSICKINVRCLPKSVSVNSTDSAPKSLPREGNRKSET